MKINDLGAVVILCKKIACDVHLLMDAVRFIDPCSSKVKESHYCYTPESRTKANVKNRLSLAVCVRESMNVRVYVCVCV